MAIYMYVYFASTFFAYLASRSKNKGMIIFYSVISVMIPCIFGGLRATGVGIDTEVYGYANFLSALSAPSMADFVVGERMTEMGYRFVCYVVANTVGHVSGCYFAYQLLTVPFMYIGAWKHRDKISLPLFMFVWYCIYYPETFNAMRQSIAMAIVFMEIDKLENRQYFKFSLAILVATLFHTSAWILFGLMLGMHMVTTSEKVDRSMWMKIVLYSSLASLTMLFSLFNALVMSLDVFAKYRMYLDRGGSDPLHTSNFILMIGEFIMLLVYSKRAYYVFMRNGKENFEYYRYNFVFSFVIAAVLRVRFSYRILMYLYNVNDVLVAALPEFVKEKHLKLAVTFAVIAVVIIYWYAIYASRAVANKWLYWSIL